MKALHHVCSEVYYRDIGYENKPYIGILVNTTRYEYIIPLTSAKEKHKLWNDLDKEKFLLYEYDTVSNLAEKDIWIPAENNLVKHILAAIDIKKMIPVKKGVYSVVNMKYSNSDSIELKKYKDLLNKEYALCLKLIDDILYNSSNLYEKQLRTGKVKKYCCDFKLLEYVCDCYGNK